jgi:hypothetical protein
MMGNLALSLALVCSRSTRGDGRYHRQQLCRHLHDDQGLTGYMYMFDVFS